MPTRPPNNPATAPAIAPRATRRSGSSIASSPARIRGCNWTVGHGKVVRCGKGHRGTKAPANVTGAERALDALQWSGRRLGHGLGVDCHRFERTRLLVEVVGMAAERLLLVLAARDVHD